MTIIFKRTCTKCNRIMGRSYFPKGLIVCRYCNPPDPNEMFKCLTCNTTKPSTEFYISHRTRCKQCFRQVMHKYYSTMTEVERKAHNEKCVACSREKYNANPEYRVRLNQASSDRYRRLKNDPEFREKINAAARRRYWKKKGENKNS